MFRKTGSTESLGFIETAAEAERTRERVQRSHTADTDAIRRPAPVVVPEDASAPLTEETG